LLSINNAMADPFNSLEIAHQGAIGLAELMQFDGRFRYRFCSQTDKNFSGYNALRHAGAIWSLLDVYNETGDKLLLDSSRRGITFMLNSYLRYFRDFKNVCICEDNKIKLGGNALSALALVYFYEITGEEELLQYADQLCSFMHKERNDNGHLIHKRYFTSGRISTFHSMYYTGEALLALLTLARQNKKSNWLQAAMDIYANLEPHYGVEEQSHWMLYSLELLTSLDPSSRTRYHAKEIVCNILEEPHYLEWKRSTPIACRTEGLLAFLRTITPEDDAVLKKKCMAQVESNLERQLKYRLANGLFIRGGEDRRHHEIRIDYTQHNISSFLHYSRMIRSK